MQQIDDPYRALGVARAASDAEIKAAHRKLAKRFHPDTAKGDAAKFLRVQEAYRVLADPLLRREWDQKHAPGPVRADRSAPAAPRRRRQPAAKPATEAADGARPPRPRERARPAAEASADERAKPRSNRAYTWSASEVPWWEEQAARSDRRQPGRKRPASEPAAAPSSTSEAPTEEPPVFSAQQDFDVYNRSSGAAWSMAARAYFRRGDADLPRRGTFQYQGTQVVTAGRARSAAAAEAKRRAAAWPPQQDVPSAADALRETRERVVRRSFSNQWPTLPQRFALALIGWLPVPVVVTLAASAATDEVIRGVVSVLALATLVAVPRLAYIAAAATLGLLVVGAFFALALVVGGGGLSLGGGLIVMVGGVLVVGYLVVGALVAFGPRSVRPWSSR
jgi:curved DNA-binding protein CbpA